MNPHQLELFYFVAKFKGVSRAVRQMPYGIQQPAVSSQVNALERDLGVALYERRPFKLTPAGEALFRFVEPFFGRIAEVREQIQGAARIRIGASPIIFRDYLPPVIDVLRKQSPGLNLILRALNQPELIDSLERDELDVAISLISENLGANLRVAEIAKLPIVLLLPRRSKIKFVTDLCNAGRIEETLIALGPNELICQYFQRMLAKLGVSWLPKMEMDSLELISRYVERGYGIGLSVRMPRQQRSKHLRVLDLPECQPVKVGVIYRSAPSGDGKLLHNFVEEVQKQAARLDCSQL